MRDVGDEVAAGGLQPLDLRHVARQQHALVLVVRDELHHQQALAAAGAAYQPWRGPVLLACVGHEIGGPHQVQQVLAAVGRQAQAQVLARDAVAPVDVEFLVQGDQPVGQRLGGGEEALHVPFQHRELAFLVAQVPVDAGQGLVP